MPIVQPTPANGTGTSDSGDSAMSPLLPLSNSGETLWRAMVETTRERLVVLDADLCVIYANPAFLRDAGEDLAEQQGRCVFDISASSWDVRPLRQMLATVLDRGTAVEDVEIHRTVRGVGNLTFRANARLVELDHEQVRLVLVAFEDVTDRRRAERKADLYSRQLERSNRELEDFAHAASHDLQEPLRKVRTFAGRLLASLGHDKLDEQQRDYATRMVDATTRMQGRIDDLLTLARVSRQWPERSSTDLQAVLETVLADFSEQLADAEVVMPVPNLPTIEASNAHMELLFQNLVSNAIKFSKADVPARIVISASPVTDIPPDEPQRIRIAFADNGIGFEMDYADRIFKPFERLHGRNEYPGSGVGLSVVSRIAELYGGTVTARAKPNDGATFEVLLPTTQPPELP